jgi:uncharacterized phage-like protein YoqJ
LLTAYKQAIIIDIRYQRKTYTAAGDLFMRKRTCCVTGHIRIKNEKLDYVREKLRTEILLAICEGYTHFISGFEEGADLIFAGIVAELKKEGLNITLEAALPYRKCIRSTNIQFQLLLKECNAIGIYNEDYNKNCFINRNRRMIQSSNRLISVYDSQERGDTVFTMIYAQLIGKEVKLIEINYN